MAGLYGILATGQVTTGTSAKTIAQIVAASNIRVRIHSIKVTFNGVSNTQEPVLVELVRQSDAGTGGDAVTIVEDPDGYSETLQTTALENIDSSEPTGSVIVDSMHVHAQGGYLEQCKFSNEIYVLGGTRLGVRVTVPTTSVSATVTIRFEE